MVNQFKHIHVIINPGSGQDEPILNRINQIFNQYKAYWTVSVTHTFGDGKRLAQEAIKNGADLIAAYGGDGTIVDVVNGLAGTDIPLAILPGGTGNGAAKELGLPIDLSKASEAIFNYPIQSIDLGFARDTYYLLRLDIGIIADVVTATDPSMKNQWGAMAYLINTATAIKRPKETFHLEFENETITIEGIGCIVTNANKIGALHFGFSENVKIDDSLLDIIIMTDIGTTVQNVASNIIKLNDNVEVNLHHWQSSSVKISVDQPQTILADGEDIGQTPIYTEVRPKALRVIKSSSKD